MGRTREQTALWVLGYLVLGAGVLVYLGIAAKVETTTVLWFIFGLLLVICILLLQSAYFLAELLRLLEDRSRDLGSSSASS